MSSERIGDSGESTAAGGEVERRPGGGSPAQGQATSGRSGSGKSGSASGTASSDPDTIVKEIEATREDLAETLDAIADRVSPKRVAARSTDRAKEVAGQAKAVLAEKAATARTVVTEKAASAKQAVDERRGISANASSIAVAGSEAPDGATAATTTGVVGLDGLPPTTGVPVPVLAPRPAHAGGASAKDKATAYVSSLPREAVAGGAGALVALLLLLLRRRRRDA